MGKFSATVILTLGAHCLGAETAFAACTPGTVELRSATGSLMRFTAEVAGTEAAREKGLMMRDKMATSAGMLFVYQQPEHAYFWMKNTLIPLDMIFADATGRVTTVHSNAAPMDETPIDGGPDVSFVLEINGGLAARLGLAPGAAMRSDAIAQSGAVWPCESP